jgi:DNA-binding CsgD family transcriptional regulator
VLEQLVAALPPGPDRAEALSLLGRNLEGDFEASTRLLDQALAEAGFDPARTADIHSFRSELMWIRGGLPEARDEAHRALADAELAGDPALVACALAQVFLFDWMCGAEADQRQLERALELERRADTLRGRTPPSQTAGWYLAAVGRFGEAEAVLRRALARAEADGAVYRRANILLRLSLLAASGGESRRAAELAAAGLEIAEQLDLVQLVAALLYACGVAALQLGQGDEVRALAARGLELSRAAGDPHYSCYHEALLGSLDLAAGAYPAAAARLLPLNDRLPSAGRSPARQRVTTDAVEALIATGELEVPGRLLAELDRSPGNPLTAAVTAGCRGALAAARGHLDGAVSELTAALRLHDQVDPQPIERGRTLLLLGTVQRRRKQRRAAREALIEAAGIFADTRAALWAARARAELARVSGRAPGQGELTTTELRVAELVCGGLSNKEAAAELFVTIRAVESTLTKVYAKLGVRSRTQLASRLRARS